MITVYMQFYNLVAFKWLRGNCGPCLILGCYSRNCGSKYTKELECLCCNVVTLQGRGMSRAWLDTEVTLIDASKLKNIYISSVKMRQTALLSNLKQNVHGWVLLIGVCDTPGNDCFLFKMPVEKITFLENKFNRASSRYFPTVFS